VAFSLNLNVKPPLHKRQAPRTKVKPPIDDFLATILVSTLVLRLKAAESS